jgi:hypothetical protein
MSRDTMEHSPRRMLDRVESDYEEQRVDPMARRETLELVRAYYRIENQQVRKRITEMVKAVSGTVDRD